MPKSKERFEKRPSVKKLQSQNVPEQKTAVSKMARKRNCKHLVETWSSSRKKTPPQACFCCIQETSSISNPLELEGSDEDKLRDKTFTLLNGAEDDSNDQIVDMESDNPKGHIANMGNDHSISKPRLFFQDRMNRRSAQSDKLPASNDTKKLLGTKRKDAFERHPPVELSHVYDIDVDTPSQQSTRTTKKAKLARSGKQKGRKTTKATRTYQNQKPPKDIIAWRKQRKEDRMAKEARTGDLHSKSWSMPESTDMYITPSIKDDPLFSVDAISSASEDSSDDSLPQVEKQKSDASTALQQAIQDMRRVTSPDRWQGSKGLDLDVMDSPNLSSQVNTVVSNWRERSESLSPALY